MINGENSFSEKLVQAEKEAMARNRAVDEMRSYLEKVEGRNPYEIDETIFTVALTGNKDKLTSYVTGLKEIRSRLWSDIDERVKKGIIDGQSGDEITTKIDRLDEFIHILEELVDALEAQTAS